ncbi:MAG: DUF6079 family protein [Pyrinomonadaceae bacterium]
MKRIQEKVKDIVEVRPYASLRDLTTDPAMTLAGYHFTDSTAGLMAKWIDAVADVETRKGRAFALAGYRGVGKSHFLATLGAIAADPELRARISDAHATASAERLLRRHYPVVYVRRGTGDSLREELQTAVAGHLRVEIAALGDSTESFFDVIATAYGELPLILIIDTAIERGERVARDDGSFLGELASIVQNRNVFLGVALDDDIAGADGLNAAIAKTFSIDYLDQEHLYKVVNAHVFPKHPNMQAPLHEVYKYFREVLPDFRWAEQRFSSLYPLHPAILEIAPFVRLHVHEFALLGFASTAGERILGRPANSLIALDEVFDNAEAGLRKVEDLAAAFRGYDLLNSEVVSKISVMQRLQAKLILKALLLFSLNGQGATAGEICAGILIFDEDNPTKSVKSVGELITQFASASPEYLETEANASGEVRYRFKVSSKDGLNRALATEVGAIDPSAVNELQKRLMGERFSDFDLAALETAKSSENFIVWRGGIRCGSVLWRDEASAVDTQEDTVSRVDHDWQVIIDLAGDLMPGTEKAIPAIVFWKPDPFTKEEFETIQKFHALSTSSELRNEFSEEVRASLHSYNLSVNRIFSRSFLDDGKLVIDGFDYNFTEEAKASLTLSEALSIMLDPLFETRYPEHPHFPQKLDQAEVSTLVTDLYSGNRQYLAEVQRLAQAFALPLGIVRDQGGALVPESEENVVQAPFAARVLQLVDAGDKGLLTLSAIYSELTKPPFGLVREAQQLILAALVAQRQIEFVTTAGDRITRRSLDLQIIWSDIAGIARPLDSKYSAKKLIRWGAFFAGASGFRSLDDLADREMLRTAFLNWTAEWRRARVLEKFESVPDDVSTARVWNVAARSAKTLGSVAENMTSCLDGSISYEECLARIADVFLDQPDEMAKSSRQLELLDSFVKGVAPRQEIEMYLALCSPTGVETLEAMRESLLELSDRSSSQPNDANNRELGYLWTKFVREFTEYYSGQHARIMLSKDAADDYAQTLRSEEWWQFSNLATIGECKNADWSEIDDLRRRISEFGCSNNVEASLRTRPFCTCSFDLGQIEFWETLPILFSEAIGKAAVRCREILFESRTELLASLKKIEGDRAEGVAEAAASVARWLQNTNESWALSSLELHVLRTAAGKSTTAGSPPTSENAVSQKPPKSAIDAEPAVLNI